MLFRSIRPTVVAPLMTTAMYSPLPRLSLSRNSIFCHIAPLSLDRLPHAIIIREYCDLDHRWPIRRDREAQGHEGATELHFDSQKAADEYIAYRKKWGLSSSASSQLEKPQTEALPDIPTNVGQLRRSCGDRTLDKIAS